MIRSRIYSIIGISAMTGILCLQDKTKKGIVISNFVTSFYESDIKPTVKKMKNVIEKVKVNANESIEKVRQNAQTLKEIGNGSYIDGMKNTYVQQFDEKENKKLVAKNIESPIETAKEKKWSEKMKNTAEKIKENANESIEKVRSNTQALKEKGNGSYIDGMKNTYKEYSKSKEENSEKMSSPKSISKIANIKKELLSELDLKSEKLVEHHIQFASMSILGSLLMPVTFFSLAVGYVVAYELYYFTKNSKNKGLLDFQQFTPIWSVFMLSGMGVFGFKIFKSFKAFKSGKKIL